MNLSVIAVSILLIPISLARLLMWVLAIPWLVITKRVPWADFEKAGL